MSSLPRSGRTLVTVIVLIGIVVVAISLFMPATRRVREAAPRAKNSNNIKQLSLALHNYESNSQPVPAPPPDQPEVVVEGSRPID